MAATQRNKQLAVANVANAPLAAMAQRLEVEPAELHDIIMQTVMPNGGQNVTQAQFVAFLAVANNYKLDPLKKEIYAFPGKGNAIQPIVSIDGWLRIIQSHPQFDGMEVVENMEGAEIVSATCTIYRKDRAHPTVITEHFSECVMNTEPWKKKPIRMTRHKAAIQCGRYAFGLSGIMDEDEYQHMTEKEVGPHADTPAEPKASRSEALADELAEEAEVIDEELPPGARLTFAELCDHINEAETDEQLGFVFNTIGEYLSVEEHKKFRDEINNVFKARRKVLAEDTDTPPAE